MMESTASKNTARPPLLECRHLSKTYGKNPALNDVSLVLPRGKIIGLLGPNGSGKTTLLKLACGLLAPQSGEILINGLPPGIESKASVAYLPERTYLNDWMRVEDIVRFFDDFYQNFSPERANDMLARLQINPKARLKTLSKGTQEKVQLIMVMGRQAELYLLDEPIGGVDPAARDYIISTIINNYDSDATVVISTHLISDIEQILDEVIFLRQGTIAAHAPVDTLREEHQQSIDAIFREVFKC
ncbi:MAG: ABC transporter ATP-binding protein [Syntrophomonadaceae bacterium]|nr:ABC transporter ATP-binding protein [Syntrophomonadaceae bacterium]